MCELRSKWLGICPGAGTVGGILIAGVTTMAFFLGVDAIRNSDAFSPGLVDLPDGRPLQSGPRATSTTI